MGDIKRNLDSLPGHTLVLQDLTMDEAPIHGRPPFRGVGLVHVRERLCVPPPQDLEQPDIVHLVHPPSTIIFPNNH